MRALDNIKNIIIPQDLVINLLNVYNLKGECKYCSHIFAKDAKTFKKGKDKENIYYLAKFLEIDFNESKLKRFSKSHITAKNSSELYFNNVKKSLALISENRGDFEVKSNDIISLANILGKDIKKVSINKLDDLKLSFMENKKSESERVFLEEFTNYFHKIKNQNKFEILSVLIAFYIDFISLDLFSYYNKEMALIIFYGYLQDEFKIFQYLPFFKYLYEIKEEFINMRNIALTNWKLKVPEVMEILKLLIPLIIKAGYDIQKLKHQYEFEKTRNKGDSLENTIMKGPQTFTKQDLRKNHPRISDSTIDRTLKRLKDEEKIMPLGTGRSAMWQRIVSGEENILDFGIFSTAKFSKD